MEKKWNLSVSEIHRPMKLIDVELHHGCRPQELIEQQPVKLGYDTSLLQSDCLATISD